MGSPTAGPRASWWGLVGLLGVMACSPDRGGEYENHEPVSFRDSAGVQIVESSRPLWNDDTRWRIDPLPALTVRTDEGLSDPPFVLFGIGNVLRLSNGHLVVENRGSRELLMFDAAGRFLRASGGRGEGPRQFRLGTRGVFRCAGDTLVVRQRRVARILGEDGTFVRSVELGGPGEGASFTRTGGVRTDCSSMLVSWAERDGIYETDRGTVIVNFRTYWAPLTAGGRVDTLPSFAARESDVVNQMVVPFGLRPSWTTDGESVYYGLGDAPEVSVFDARGRLVRYIRWRAPATPITGEHWAAYHREFDSYLSRGADPRAADLRQTPETVPLDSLPVFGAGEARGDTVPALKTDHERNLWVRRYKRLVFTDQFPRLRELPSSQSWWVFDPEGRWLGEVETPEHFRIREIGEDYLLGVSADVFGIEEIQMYRIDKGRRR